MENSDERLAENRGYDIKKAHTHFSKIARRYNDLRITDTAPITFIKNKLKNLKKIEMADIGCGTGRYDIELFRCLGDKLNLTCIDTNERMLDALVENMEKHNISRFKVIKSPAEKLPLPDNSLDCMVTFNAIHHFVLSDFLDKVSCCLKNNGYLFIYTRLRSQNKRSIWGKYFPGFHEKETLLYELEEIENILNDIMALKLESVEYFHYRRKSSLEELVTQAGHNHYSTFYLHYEPEEFERALEGFQDNIKRHFENTYDIIWDNEMTMLVVRKSK